MLVKDYLKGIFEVFLPRTCILCGQTLQDGFLCRKCLDFKVNKFPVCKKCGVGINVSDGSRICKRCSEAEFYFDRSFSPFFFTEPLSGLIHLLKYKGYGFLETVLGKSFAKALDESFIDFSRYDIVTYIPLHRRKLREREYNQSYILARFFADYFKIELRPVLELKRYTSPQVARTAGQRKLGVKDNFRVKADIEGLNIILIDDVFTTGSTLSEASKVMKQFGGGQILALTLAIAGKV